MEYSQITSPITITNLLAIYLILVVLVTAALLVRSLIEKDEKALAINAVFLVGWLNMFAWITGFSIGLWVAAATLLIGIVLLVFVKHYRYPLVAVTLASLLLLLFLRGFYPPAIVVLYLALGASSIILGIWLFNHRSQTGNEDFSLAMIGFVSSLTSLIFIFVTHGLFPGWSFYIRWVMILTILAGIGYALRAKTYRMKQAHVLLGAILMTAVIFFQ